MFSILNLISFRKIEHLPDQCSVLILLLAMEVLLLCGCRGGWMKAGSFSNCYNAKI
jgi:hypothetical protein